MPRKVCIFEVWLVRSEVFEPQIMFENIRQSANFYLSRFARYPHFTEAIPKINFFGFSATGWSYERIGRTKVGHGSVAYSDKMLPGQNQNLPPYL